MRLQILHPHVRSIRGRLMLVVAAVLLPAALLTWWLIAQNYQNHREATESHLRDSARALTLLVDAMLEEREAVLAVLARSDLLASRDFAGFRKSAEAVMQGRDGWIILMDGEFRQRVNTSQPVDTVLPRVEPTPDLVEAMEEGRTFFSNFALGSVSRRPLLYLSLPVLLDNERFVLSMTVPPDALADTLLHNRLAEDWLVSLVDREGTVAARSRTPELYLGHKASARMVNLIKSTREGVAGTVSLDGVNSITAFSRSSETGWTVIIAAPRDEVFAAASGMVKVALCAAVITAIGALLTATGAGRAIVDAIQTLVKETQALGRGELLEPRNTGINETDFVSRALADTSRELAERQTALARARDSALAASRAKDEFLAALSHELRTPLNPVLLLASDAAADPANPPASREAFATIAKNVMLEARLIDDLLDLTRITRGKMLLERRAIDLHAVVRDAIATVRAALAEKGHELKLELDAETSVVVGDSTRLQQVFWNLLSNAIKFTPNGGRIVLRSRVLSSDIVVDVSDTGIGITPEEAGRIFVPFAQGDHAVEGGAHRFGGLGLGLAITRRLVEAHAGRLALHSVGRGCGTTFTVSLPLASDQRPAEPSLAGAGSEEAAIVSLPSRVLLVEDHEPTRSALAMLLRRRGYEVIATGGTAEALSEAAQHRFAWVISDIGLPDGDGYALMRALRERHGLRGIALSGYGMEEDIERGRAAGFVTHLTKPVDVRTLGEALARMQGAVA